MKVQPPRILNELPVLSHVVAPAQLERLVAQLFRQKKDAAAVVEAVRADGPRFLALTTWVYIAWALVRIYSTATITDVPAPLLYFGNTFSIGTTPEAFAAFMKAELAKYERVVKASGAMVD